MKKAVAVLELPANPLDNLIDLLGGPNCVAEMTGRKARLVRQAAGEGGARGGVKWEARNASGVGANATLDLINVHERQMFLNLEKRIAIISEAASAGISLHADRSACCQHSCAAATAAVSAAAALMMLHECVKQLFLGSCMVMHVPAYMTWS